MPTKDPRIDAYIEQSGDFARPILTKLRALVHKGCPEVVESIKWGMPAFEYKGPFCGMASFKKHCTFGFWKAELLFKDKNAAISKAGEKLSWGVKRDDATPAHIKDLKELPSDAVFLKILKEAMKLNEAGVSVPRRDSATTPIPKDFQAALRKSRKAVANFEAFAPSHKREYVKWITEAKREETRQERIATAVEWITEGKSRNWKYSKK